jgi:hypothetical protein
MKRLLLWVALILFPLCAFGASTYQAEGTVSATGNTTASGTISVTASSTLAVAVFMTFNGSSVPSISSFTVGGLSATAVSNTTAGSYPVGEWFCVAAGSLSTGSQTISITWTGTYADANGVAISATGVNQSTPCINGQKASGSSPQSISISSGAGDLTISGAGSYTATSTVSSPGVQTIKVSNNVSSYYSVGAIGAGSGSAETHKYATSGSNLMVSGFDFEAATPQASTPTFSPVAGTYANTQTVTINAATGPIICYNYTGSPATNGVSGCPNGTLYSGAITVSSPETIYAVAGGTGYLDSSVASAAYAFTVANPTISLATGTYTTSLPRSTTLNTTSTGAYLCLTSCNTYGCTPATPVASPPGTCPTGTLVNSNSISYTLPVGYTSISVLGTQANYTNSGVVTTSGQYDIIPTLASLHGTTVGYSAGNIRFLNASTLLGTAATNINSHGPLAVRPATWGTMDLWVPCNTGTSPGTALTSTILTNCLVGSPSGLSITNSVYGAALTIAASSCGMGGTITVGSTTYPVGSTTLAMAYNPTTNDSAAYLELDWTGTSTVIWNGCLTVGIPLTSSYSNEFSFGAMYDSATVNENLQLWGWDSGPSGTCGLTYPYLAFDIEMAGTITTIRSGCTQTAYGSSYLFSMQANETTETTYLALYDPITFRQVGSNMTVTPPSGFGGHVIQSIRVFQTAPSIAATGGLLTIENSMLDINGHNTWPDPPH